MWPWEHAAFGYLCYSPLLHIARHRGPDGRAAALLLVGAVVPDAVDKTLSWGLGVFPTGYAVGHSVFVAVPLGAALLWARWSDATLAFVVGYWSHLVGDVLDPLRYGDAPAVTRTLYPVVVGEAYAEDLGVGRGAVYLTEFLRELPGTDLTSPAAVYLLLPAIAVLLWLADGAPGTALCRRFVTAIAE